MIHEIGVELQANLKAIGCPLKVIDGPERTTTTTGGRERIVLEHDDTGEESFSFAIGGSRVNPKQHFVRNQAMKIRIYAQASGAGAQEFEHRRRADHILDLVVVQMRAVALNRKNVFSPKSGKFVVDGDLAKSEVIAGAVYELKFTFDRGMLVQNFDGSFQKTTTVAGINTTTKVSNVGDQTGGSPSMPPPDAETVS